MDVPAVTRLASVERRVLWGLIEENVAAPEAGAAQWEQDWARDEHLPWIAVESPVREVRDDQPTGANDTGRRSLDWAEAEDYIPWAATVFPADAEHLSWIGGLSVAERAMSYTEVRHDAVRVLDALRTHEGRIGRLTQAILVAGLSAASVDERVRAVDAVTQLGLSQRLTADGLAMGIRDVGPLTPCPGWQARSATWPRQAQQEPPW